MKTIVITIENADDAMADMFAERIRNDAQLTELGAKIEVSEEDDEKAAAKRKKK